MSRVILFLDDDPKRHNLLDSRHPTDVIIHTYDIHDFRAALEEHDHFDVVSLDFDLNNFEARSFIGDSEATGLDACGYMVRYKEKLPRIVFIHSSNDSGSKSMAEFLSKRGVTSRRSPL